MNPAIVVKLQLQETVSAARLHPEEAHLVYLCDLLEQATGDLELNSQLWVAGEILSQIIDLFEARSALLFESLEAGGVPREPVVPRDYFRDLVRQSMQVDFAALIERQSAERKKPTPADLETVTVTLDTWLDACTPAPSVETPTLADLTAIASVEDIAGWSNAITTVMAGTSTTLSELQRQLPLSFIEIWLGLLLGQYRLEPLEHHFYGSDCWVHCPEPIS